MKLFKFSLLAALISSPLAAQEIDKEWQLGVFGDYIKSSTNKDNQLDWQRIEAGKSLGFDLKKEINDLWSMRLELARTRYDIDNGNDKSYGYRYGVDAIYNVENSDFYLFTGIKRFNNVKDYYAVNVGGGYNIQINDRLSAYTEAAIYRDVDYGFVDQGFKIGLQYTFGETKSVPVAKPAPTPIKPAKQEKTSWTDADNDGVLDQDDQCPNTAANLKVDSKGCVVYTTETDEITLAINFAHDSAFVEPANYAEIKRLADFMKKYPETSVEIEGHTSAKGKDAYNMTLSEKRAQAVKQILIEQFSINSNRLSAKGYGETRLLATENSAQADKKNRRVVAKISTSTQKAVSK
ncbi:OmpA family protein [Thalassotalea marina]|uniref:OmpA-like domain-containing protein n=1 Tax=Thalassotalea marina TaxID=1673741 RepID=A0A919ENC0_9GAMM|nr:OmpA family protein [Thalassotalea marina]GHG04077.1 hypothetical protein GCM10017161_36870 [Thalassotalea marina]